MPYTDDLIVVKVELNTNIVLYFIMFLVPQFRGHWIQLGGFVLAVWIGFYFLFYCKIILGSLRRNFVLTGAH